MKKPLHLDIPEQYREAIIFKSTCPPTARYRLAYAECSYWKHPGFTVIEQYYDAKDAFISLLQIDTHNLLEFPLSFNLHDLYWFYQLNGTLPISEGHHQHALIAELLDEHYHVAYLPPNYCTIKLAKGKHLLFYFVIKTYWLMRRPTRRMEELQSLFAKLRAKTMESAVLPAIAIRPKHRQVMLFLFNQPKRLPVEQDCVVYDSVIQLLTLSLHDMKQPETAPLSKAAQLIKATHELIRKKLALAQPLLIYEIAADFGVSTQYLCRMHRKYFHVSLKRYISEQKFNHARMLLVQEGLDISTVAHRLGYSQPAAFTKQFTQYFGLSPSASRPSK